MDGCAVAACAQEAENATASRREPNLMDTGFTYMYYPAPANFTNAAITGGPVTGGTLVEMTGAGIELPDARGIFCQFGGAGVVSASYDGEEAVRCIAPAIAAAGWVAVHVISNDAVYASSVAYEYLGPVGVSLGLGQLLDGERHVGVPEEEVVGSDAVGTHVGALLALANEQVVPAHEEPVHGSA